MPAPRKPSWDSALRDVIKTEHGYGWSIRGHRGKVQLTRRFEDGSRSSVSLDHDWNASCQSDVIQALIPVRDLAALMGHNPATHHRHDGKWTDEAGLEEALARAVGMKASIGKVAQ